MMSLYYGFHFPVQMVQRSAPTLLNSLIMGVVVEEARVIPLPLMRKRAILLQNVTRPPNLVDHIQTESIEHEGNSLHHMFDPADALVAYNEL